MSEVLGVLQCLHVCLDPTTFHRLVLIVTAMLTMTGRVTMRGISRWTEQGGSYRTVQRFFATPLNWARLNWCVIRHQLSDPEDVIIVAGDESVATKAGTETYGLGRFFSSLFGKPVAGIAIFTVSLISTKRRQSFPVLPRQVVPPDSDDTPSSSASTTSQTSPDHTSTPKSKSKSKSKSTSRGRPKGSKNTNREDVVLAPYLLEIQDMLRTLQALVGPALSLVYAVFDGAFGHNYALQMVRRCGMHLISKLQDNSALYFPYTGSYSGRGPRRKYGKKLNDDTLSPQYLKSSTTEKKIRTDIYQMSVLHKLFPQLLNVVIIVKTNLKTQARAHVILFSSDLTLSYEKLIDSYQLRFQIEFNFRDAKQYWGLEDFMNVKEQPLTTAINLSFFLVNVSQILCHTFRQTHPHFSLEDLKARFRGLKYVKETLQLLSEKPEPMLIQQITDEIAKLGSINVA